MVVTCFFEGSTIRDSNKYGIKQGGLKFGTHVVKAQHLGRSDYCTQSRRAVKSDDTLPKFNTRRRIIRGLRGVFRDANEYNSIRHCVTEEQAVQRKKLNYMAGGTSDK